VTINKTGSALPMQTVAFMLSRPARDRHLHSCSGDPLAILRARLALQLTGFLVFLR
jgi:hypothetical protein